MTRLTVSLLGLMVLAGSGHCLFQYSDDIGAEMRPGLRSQGFPVGGSWGVGGKNLIEIFAESLRQCICVDMKQGGSSKQQQCQCIAEIRDCDIKNEETVDTTLDDIPNLAKGWTACLGDERMVAAYQCRARMFAQPFQLACKAQGNTCS